jgi:hypothetical protein
MFEHTHSIKVAFAASAAGVLVWLGVTANINRGCALEEATIASLCGEVPAAGSAARLVQLRQRIAANPGDSPAYTALSFFPQSAERQAMVRAASMLAPNDPNMLMARAAMALEQNRFGEAAKELVQLTEYSHHLTQQPARTLANMVAQGHASLLREHLKSGSQWFPLVLGTMAQLRIPLAAASPLLSRAVKQGALPAERVGSLIGTLKEEGSWVDAYALWLARHGGTLPILYNAGFDDPLEADGFDWEIASQRAGREGASVAIRPMAERGNVLDVLFTGRSMPAAIVSQHVFLAPGRYQLSGQYSASGLRTESGLAWAVRCDVNKAPQLAGKSTELRDTQGRWQPFEFAIKVPERCGTVATLELSTFAAYEAAAGIRGRAYFDAFKLQKLTP